ncbi:hypothetical protein [Pseudoduganella namucuonensis]|uniref:hypothetical protein n=1 Tax=Pseudoduganella namucuonensis TaxID=1035707 RepID=UPI001E368B31|nr:hypothetical protein [Pseudoduganella namucuonensis]
MPLNHINVHIGMPKRGELGWPAHVVQAWQKLKQRAVVLLIEIHVDSTLFYGTGTIHGKLQTDNAVYYASINIDLMIECGASISQNYQQGD